MVTSPSDCLKLQRSHVKFNQIKDLTVYFGTGLCNSVNGPAHQEPSETWTTALHHILNTFTPDVCFLHTDHYKNGHDDYFTGSLSDGLSYNAYWNERECILSIIP